MAQENDELRRPLSVWSEGPRGIARQNGEKVLERWDRRTGRMRLARVRMASARIAEWEPPREEEAE